MAEKLFNHYIKEAGLNYIGDSCALPGGQPISAGSLQLLLERASSKLRSISKQFTPDMISGSRLVLTMEERQRDFLRGNEPNSVAKILTLNEYLGEPGDIADPFGSGIDLTNLRDHRRPDQAPGLQAAHSSQPLGMIYGNQNNQKLIEQHGLSEEEYARIKEIRAGPPLMWNGHFQRHVERTRQLQKLHQMIKTLPRDGNTSWPKQGGNAGVVDIGDGLAISFKISHNHPPLWNRITALLGVGGILRDFPWGKAHRGVEFTAFW